MNRVEFKVEPVCDVHTEDIKTKSTSINKSSGDAIVYPPGCVLTKKFALYIEKLQNFEVYPDDTWVCSFPKCGTTWTQEMVWLLVNKLDYETARTKYLRERFPFIELESIMNEISDEEIYPKTVELAANAARPRCIKTHLPLALLPSRVWTVKPKIVYVAREPRDAMISYYHHHRLWIGYTGTLEDFANVFLADRVVYAPYWKHVLDYWSSRGRSNVLFNTYEEMKRDLPRVVRRTAEFLDVNLSDEQLSELCEHLSFKNMKNNPSVNYRDVGNIVKQGNNVKDDQLQFMRKGESGGWQKTLTKDIMERFDQWDEEHLKNSEFSTYPWS